MSAIVTGVLKLTFGFLVDKTRSGIGERLKDGDITDEKCRRLFVTELDDIKTKLDGLARKDLRSSVLFLQEGINGLYQSLFQLDSTENAAEPTTQATLVEATSSTDTGSDSVIDEAIALANAIASFKMRSNDRFKSAIESFKLARIDATKAFGNEALSIEDRIQASQIRMMARILEKLEDPDACVSDCLQYLKQLHDIGAIQETFSVLINKGVKSCFNKTKRLEHASSVQVMNQILFAFARNFTKLPPRYLDWPMIFLGEKSYHPVVGESRLAEKLEEFGVQAMSLNPDFTLDDEIFPELSAVNSKGDILAITHKRNDLKIFKRSAKSRTLCKIPREERWTVAALDIDAEDNIYFVTQFRDEDEKLWNFKLFIFDENGNTKLESTLPFDQRYYHAVCLVLNKDGKIAILDCEEKILYEKIGFEQNLFQSAKRISFIPRRIEFPSFVAIKKFADNNSTKIIAANSRCLYIYIDNGRLENKITPDGGLIQSVTINHVTKCILVAIKIFIPRSTSLQRYSGTGELIDSLNLGSSEWMTDAELISHPNGSVALVGKTGATFFQL